MSGPFAEAWRDLYRAGWHPIQIPPGRKSPPPKGTTGAAGEPYSWPDLHAVEATCGHWNVGARFPLNVVGLDYDAYKAETGFADLTLGLDLSAVPLVSSGRSDGSCTYLWLLPDGFDQAELADSTSGVDIIRFGHRYIVAPPSIHPEGRRYEASINGRPISGLPLAAGLPLIPALLLARLPRKQAHTAGTGDSRCLTPGAPCRRVQNKLETVLALPWTDRHSTARDAAAGLVRLGENGHTGVAAALLQVRRRFITAVAGENRDAEGEWARLVDGAVAKIGGSVTDDERTGCGDGACGPRDGLSSPRPGPQPAPGAADPYPSVDTSTGEVLTTDSMFDLTPELQHVQRAALSRRRSPVAVLGAVLALIAGETTHQLKLPPIIGSYASLNLLVMLCGSTGAGKSTSMRIALELLGWGDPDDVPEHVKIISAASGEGLAETFFDRSGAVPVRNLVLMNDEFEELAKIGGRSGSTFFTTLRKAAHGEGIGQQLADASRSRIVKAGSYRFAAVLGIQPELTSHILSSGEVNGGTPQRFLWINIRKPAPGPATVWPGPLAWSPPAHPVITASLEGITEPALVGLPPGVAEYVVENDAQSETVHSLDRHAVLMRLKVSAAVGMLHGRYNMFSPLDWRIAGVLVASSRETIDHALAALAAEAEKLSAARGAEAGFRAGIKEEVIASNKYERVQRCVVRMLTASPSDWVARRDIRMHIHHRDRDVLGEVLAGLTASGAILERPGERKGKFYRARSAERH